jgi:hypothetical protein
VTPAIEDEAENGRNALALGIIDVDMDIVSPQFSWCWSFYAGLENKAQIT